MNNCSMRHGPGPWCMAREEYLIDGARYDYDSGRVYRVRVWDFVDHTMTERRTWTRDRVLSVLDSGARVRTVTMIKGKWIIGPQVVLQTVDGASSPKSKKTTTAPVTTSVASHRFGASRRARVSLAAQRVRSPRRPCHLDLFRHRVDLVGAGRPAMSTDFAVNGDELWTSTPYRASPRPTPGGTRSPRPRKTMEGRTATAMTTSRPSGRDVCVAAPELSGSTAG